MKKNTSNSSRLFFTEFLIVLFFFLLISTICLKLFVGAHSVTQQANALSAAQSYASSFAEAVSATDGSSKALQAFFPEASITDTGLILYFDREFQTCEKVQAYYTMTASLTTENHQTSSNITVKDQDGNVLYELPLLIHHAQTKKEALS